MTNRFSLREAEIKVTADHHVILEMATHSAEDADRLYRAVQAELRSGLVVFDDIEIGAPDQFEEQVSS